ncbi:cilia- and flagella-associated protein 44-like isoform X2 [Mizuhopecten yessoensis]|uniref:cilia- and flagella-associated protein 44-like isoform X2 n=1 Tax=Mizuhopecten yessoensis TaxID=6573 RepID=UPI000B45D081|nr:cilia- and flagella-associated protein 44-like isoform X2 [Mizuhopecten yessoensis]
MEGDGEKPPSPKPENPGSLNSPASGSGNEGRKSRNLKEATSHLKEEALRRYRLRQEAMASSDSGGEGTPLPPGTQIPKPPEGEKPASRRSSPRQRTTQSGEVSEIQKTDTVAVMIEEKSDVSIEEKMVLDTEHVVENSVDLQEWDSASNTPVLEIERSSLSRERVPQTRVVTSTSVDIDTISRQIITTEADVETIEKQIITTGDVSGLAETEILNMVEMMEKSPGERSEKKVTITEEVIVDTVRDDKTPEVQESRVQQSLGVVQMTAQEMSREPTLDENLDMVAPSTDEVVSPKVSREATLVEEDIVPTHLGTQEVAVKAGQSGEATGGEPTSEPPLVENKAPEQEAEKAPEQEAEKAPEQEAEKAPEQEAGKAPEQEAEKAPDQEAEKAPEQEAEKAPEQEAAKAPEQEAEKAPEQAEEKPTTEEKPQEQAETTPGQTEESPKTGEEAPKQTTEEKVEENVKVAEKTEGEEGTEKTPGETEKAPEGDKLSEGETAPEQVQEGEKAPEQAQQGEKAPEPAQEGEKPSEQAKEGEKAPEQAQEGEKAPEQAQEGEKAPEQAQEGEKAPEQAQEGEKAPEDGSGDKPVEGEKAPEQTQDAEQQESVVMDKPGDETNNAAESEGKEEAQVEVNEEAAEENKETEEKEKGIPADFFYDLDKMTSKPVMTEDCGLPEDMLSLQYSFGYDCTKRANLHLLDEKTVIFAAGNLVQLVDLQTREHKYLRSTSGGGIGALTVHPSKKFFAVAEKGQSPNINIFEYPSLKLHRILRGGTEKSYSYVDFSSDGELLASQGGNPDFMLTVWRWREEMTVLRSKAFSQDVFRATFSTELEGQLTTAGTTHIRFWKMADTFTGLKLQGALGKFGKTEISDVEGYVELPDGKVLSGCEWGNMLLWEGGLIKVEISCKGRKPCHVGNIMQILLDEGELMTVGEDGFIKVWDFESVDTADTTDDTGMFEMEPMNELRVGEGVKLQSICKSFDAETEMTFWFAQDANGGIWKLDLSFSHTSLAPEKMFTYHAGAILGCDTSPISHIVATTGHDHTVRVFDYLQRKQLCETKFSAGGSALLWAPEVVDPKGATILVGFSDGVVRVFNISQLTDELTRKHKNDCDLVLQQAFKPHSSSVNSLAVNKSGDILATAGEDGTIFFLTVGTTYNPIGFVTMPAAVKKIQWSPETKSVKKETLLVFCDKGIVVEIDSPGDSNFDTSHTFKITGLPTRQFTFKSVKSALRHEEDMERKKKEEEERKKKEAEERRKRIERGLETESEQGDEEEEKKESEEDWTPYIPSEPSPILEGFYTEDGNFWLSMGDFDSGYLYQCKFLSPDEKAGLPEELVDQPIKSVPVVDSEDVPINIIKFSSNGRQVLMGMSDGAVRIYNLETPYDMSTMGPFWTLTMHDNNYGHVTGLKSSYDNTMLLTVGGDSNFFLYNYMGQEEIDQKTAENKAKIPSARKRGDEIIDDIDDPNAYSIEDAKQKSEHDKMMKHAEEKKRDVRQRIAHLRRQFKTLLEQNENLPNHLQLKKDEFEMDREIKYELQRQKSERMDIVRRERAWESEKHRIALEKLRKRFKDVVECERIVVKAFNTSHEIASFRAAKLSDDFYTLKADFERRRTQTMMRDDLTRDPTRDLMTGQTRHTDLAGEGEKKDDQSGLKVTTTLKGSMGERISKALYKVEEKKKKRAARKAQWSDLYNTKPDDDYEDPADVSAIKEAKDNMGDYKLKTAQDYVVPDHLRMNVEKARGRLLILKDIIHEQKYHFNLRLLSLRDKKLHVIEEIKELIVKLEDIQTHLPPEKCKSIPPVPRMYPVETPEKKLEYTRETLVAFKKEKDEAAAAKKGGGAGGFGGFGGGSDDKKGGRPSPTPGQKHAASSSDVSKGKSSEDVTEGEPELSPLEQQMMVAEEIMMLYNQDYLLKKIDELLSDFDAELRLLRHDKFRLDIVMKNADLRQVTLFEEFVLLKEFEKREDVLAAKVTGKQQEKLDMQLKIIDVQGKLEAKKKEIEKLLEKERSLNITFHGSLGDNNKFSDYLSKVFKKKIKRAKKKTTDEGSDDDSDEDSSDDDDWDEDEDDEDEDALGYDLDICPSGCDQNLYDNTCQMREKRLDIEEALTEEKKNNEALKKELDSFNRKAKVIDAGLKTAANDLEAFQLEKQQKLNELDVIVTLKLHQIQYMLNGQLPQDLSQTLVFESNGVVRLQQRIKELEHEKHAQKKHMRESKRKHVQLIKDRKVFDSKIGEMESECDKLMVDKFGCIVDLEKLETITVNRQIEELKEKLRITEIQCSEEIEEWNEKIVERKDRITHLIRDNTRRLDQLCVLLNDKKEYESSLDVRQESSGEEYSGARKADIREKQRLIQLVQLQAQEIDALKEEIMLLSRKGGHILPPAQPPLPQTPQNVRTISN